MTVARGSGLGAVGKTVQRLLLMGIVCLGFSLWVDTLVVAQEASQTRNRRTASGWPTKDSKDQHKDLDAAIQEKLKRILANQQTILQKAEAVKQELGVIKVRASTPARSVTFLSTGQPCP